MPNGYVDNADDCNDQDASAYKGAGCETSLGCWGTLSENCTCEAEKEATTWYEDSDGDGYGNSEVSVYSCNQPNGYVWNGDDCDDTDSTKFPGAECMTTEGCWGWIDEKCFC